ncbi:MAG TPA: RsmB/NOP family class I SAM-dependent RNA methyltransferase, partial [Hyphomicrobiales bacterium]|nr:RsmB/NOP family class I SAM-dependent RNA methyltransferase [Hyphomicrobiales bacterium]
MRLGGRIAAAIEVLADIEARHRPAAEALKDWGTGHRFAGSADRAAIGNLVFDCLRQRRSLSWRMGAETPRALALAAVAGWGLSLQQIEEALAGDPHAPESLSEAERAALATDTLGEAPDEVRADMPDWLWPGFSASLTENAVAEGRALAARAPLDLRVNRLKSDRDKVLKALSRFGARPTELSPDGVRIDAPAGLERLPNIQAEAAFRKGWFEVQDEGSQVAAVLSGAKPGDQVADICAGAGGKTLALAAMMENKGQIHAYDADRHRLKNIFGRLKRAGTRNVQVHSPGEGDPLASLEGKMDIVFIDAPCSGSGVWRRHPDAKWRMKPEALARRMEDQRAVLDRGAELVRPGGRLVYVTCSLLAEENGEQVLAFLRQNKDFA